LLIALNILVLGGPHGKTTLSNGIIDPCAGLARSSPCHHRDTSEIQCAAEEPVVMRATDTVDMQRRLKATMRLRPAGIIVARSASAKGRCRC